MTLISDVLNNTNVTEHMLDKIAQDKGGLIGTLTSKDDPKLFNYKLSCIYGYTTVQKPGPKGSNLSRVFLVGTTDQKRELIKIGKERLIQKSCPTWGASVVKRYLEFRSVNSGVFFYAPYVYKYLNDNIFRSIIDSMPEENLNKTGVYNNCWRKANNDYFKKIGISKWTPSIEIGFVKFLKELKRQKFISF
jgi:hypothetical protein